MNKHEGERAGMRCLLIKILFHLSTFWDFYPDTSIWLDGFYLNQISGEEEVEKWKGRGRETSRENSNSDTYTHTSSLQSHEHTHIQGQAGINRRRRQVSLSLGAWGYFRRLFQLLSSPCVSSLQRSIWLELREPRGLLLTQRLNNTYFFLSDVQLFTVNHPWYSQMAKCRLNFSF